MANHLSATRQALILRLLCEGNSLRSTSRITGCHTKTIGRVINLFGTAAQYLLDESLQGLNLRHVEVDEVWTFVAKKQACLTLEERQTRHDIGDVYLWTCIDQDTKLVASHLVGKRSADNARRLMVDLASRINLPGAGSADDHAYVRGQYRPVVQISTDGLAAYPEAVDLAFGPFAWHGVIIKEYRNASMQYDPSEMVATQRRIVRGNLDKWSICTSHIERHNLTVRTFMKRFTRLSLGFSKKLECLKAAASLYLAYYNFVWRSRYTDNSGQPGRRRPPAAMAAGIVNKLWRFDDFFDALYQLA